MKVTFRTLGCKVNQYETQCIREQFLGAGFEEAPANSPSDIYVINTCTVTHKADSESRRLIRNARRENPLSRVIVTGCYTELDRDEIEKVAANLIILKNSKKSQILRYLRDCFGVDIKRCQPLAMTGKAGLLAMTVAASSMAAISRFEGRTKAFVKVQDGCDNFCSYCKVPLVRGRSRSRGLGEIISEVQRLVSNGYKEIILTGVCLGDWGRDLNRTLINLLDEIENRIKGIYRIRLSSIEPWYVTEGLIKKIASSKRLCRHLHIPMQSGDDEILKKMNRRFSSGDFLGLISELRSFISEVAFTTDILVGFPGEEEEHFNNTLKLVEATRPSRSHIFPFSIRQGTSAASLVNELVPADKVKDRTKRLRNLTERLSAEYKRQFLGKTGTVLVETTRNRQGLLTGFTDTYIKLSFQGPDELKGKFASVTC